MEKSYPTLEEVLTKTGFIPKWKEEGRLEEKEKIVRNLLADACAPQVRHVHRKNRQYCRATRGESPHARLQEISVPHAP